MTDDSLMDRVFLALDKGPSPCISMETWANALSLFLRGTLEEKIQFCFTVILFKKQLDNWRHIHIYNKEGYKMSSRTKLFPLCCKCGLSRLKG